MKNGPYNLVLVPKNYPGKKYRWKYAYEHHFIFWKLKNLLIKEDEIIHHLNGDKRDNRIENLKLMKRSLHSSQHSQIEKIDVICSKCEIVFYLTPNEYQYRKNKSNSGDIFCGRKCQHLSLKNARWRNSRRTGLLSRRPKKHVGAEPTRAAKVFFINKEISNKFNSFYEKIYSFLVSNFIFFISFRTL